MAKEKKQESSYFVPNVSDNYELTPEAYKEIYRIVNRRRPYCRKDFIPQTFFPDLVVALLMTANFAGAPVWLKNTVPQNKKVATVANQQPRTQANCINYFTASQKAKGR